MKEIILEVCIGLLIYLICIIIGYMMIQITEWILNKLKNKKMKVKLMYVTEEGYEWLEEIIDVNDFNYMSLIDDYVVRNQVKAESLENKWRLNGEDVTLILDVEPIDGQFDYKNELLVKVSKYIDNI
jgi:hypothetical protein